MGARSTLAAAVAAVTAAATILTPTVAAAEPAPVTPQQVNVNPKPVPAGGVVKIRAGAPNSTVMGNLTVTQPSGDGYTSAYPCAAGLPVDGNGNPNTSVNNYKAGQTVPNFAAVKTDHRGEICIYTRAAAHLIWDQTVETSAVQAETAKRLMDTRQAPAAPPREDVSGATCLSAGEGHACAIVEGGKVNCWGRSEAAPPDYPQ